VFLSHFFAKFREFFRKKMAQKVSFLRAKKPHFFAVKNVALLA
jgi:hypothetical protein